MDITFCLIILALIHFIVGVFGLFGFFRELSFNDKDKSDLIMYMFFATWGLFLSWVLLKALTVINILLP